MKYILVGDKHLRKKAPHLSANQRYYQWFLSQPFNSPENIYLDLGDHFDRAEPSPDETELWLSFVQGLQFKKKLWLAGNHCYSKNKETLSIQPLTQYESEGHVIVDKPMLFQEGRQRLGLLPFEYRYKGKQDYYNELAESFGEIDLLSYHFPDETQSFGGKSTGTNLSSFQARLRISGDIHIQGKNYLGVPFPTRKDERGQRGQIALLDDETGEVSYIDVPMFLDYSVVKFGNQPKMNPEGETVLYVYDAPSFESVRNFYKNFFIGEIKLLQLKPGFSAQTEEGKEQTKDLTILEHFEEFSVNRQLDPRVKAKVLEVLK